MPIKNEMLLWDLAASINNQLHHLLEVSFPQWNLVWVDVHFLECSEEQFTWCGIITVWSHLSDWNSKPLQHLHSTSCFVVSSTYNQRNYISEPVWIRYQWYWMLRWCKAPKRNWKIWKFTYRPTKSLCCFSSVDSFGPTSGRSIPWIRPSWICWNCSLWGRPKCFLVYRLQ